MDGQGSQVGRTLLGQRPQSLISQQAIIDKAQVMELASQAAPQQGSHGWGIDATAFQDEGP